ncbi:hypothetical protein V497_03225 [Pseudogymnoascus sp. VKM F-4516 (FW-969)]|nr:hypothetical protein V497_03225 [Pseudogymnoascus sp. VKM F-4516 (FW-969)]
MSDTARLAVAQPKLGANTQSSNQSNPFDTPFDEPDWDEESLDENGRAGNFPDNKSDVSRMTQWPSFSNLPAPPPMPHKPQMKTRKSVKRSSVIRPIREKSKHRQRKQNEMAGIKLNTNVGRHRPLAPVVTQPKQNAAGPLPAAQTSRFVDLAALQTLESRAAPNNGGFWKNLLGNAPNPPAAAKQTFHQQDNSNEGTAAKADPTPGFANRRAKDLRPPSLTMEGDLSPNDRPIVIGISIPSARMQQHITSPQTAGSETSNILNCYDSQTPKENAPETPVIVITPAEVSYWSPISANTVTPQSRRVASSVYSRPASYPHSSDQQEEIPPMPQISSSILKSQKAGRESVGTIFAEDEDDEILSARPKKLRIGTGAILEEDERQILSRKTRSGSDGSEKRPRSMLSPNDRRTSNGWWNTILSPFLTRSNTVNFPQTSKQGESPAVPDIATPDTKSGHGDFRFWEKALSPKSPLSSTTIASDDWWDNRNTIDGTPKWDGLDSKFKDGIYTYKAEESYGTLPLALSRSTRAAATASHQQPNMEAQAGELQRDQSLAVRSDRSSILSPADREAPFMLDDPSVDRSSVSKTSGNQQTPPPQSSSAAPPAMGNTSTTTQVQTRRPSENAPKVVTPAGPPPYSPPRPGFPKYAAVYPPGHGSSAAAAQQPQSPGPLSPGLQQAMSSTGAIALTDVPLTPATRRVINLNSGYPTLPRPTINRPVNPVDIEIASEKARKIDAKRRRHEKEEVVAHKAGGLWRGRGCISNRGCYGRTGPEGRKRRRCWLGVVGLIIGLTILIVALATQLHKSTPSVEVPSQWVNLTVFPPIYTGVSTVSSTTNNVANTGCVYPKTVWSCALPKELQASVSPSKPNQPNLKLHIQWDNSSAANATWGGPTGSPTSRRAAGNAVNAGQLLKRLALTARQAVTFSPSPAPPSIAEQGFLGNTTDGIVSDNKSGERTPFYVTFLNPEAAGKAPAKISTRQEKENGTSELPDFSKSIPPPDLNADGTAAPANLFPTPEQQPLRLFDRGLPTEHYGFYSYFNRSIFLKSTALLNETNAGDGEVPDDLNGGCKESEARFRCTWSQTRFLVQMWTRKDTGAALLNSTTASSDSNSGTVTTTILGQENSSAFPYPITITTDRHGGDPGKKGVFCYEINEREKVVAESGKVRPEFRAFGGTLVNQAPNAFDSSSDAGLGGFDGGDSGCSCQWANWQPVK